MDQNPEFDLEGDATVFGFTGEVWSLRGVSGELFGKTISLEHTFTIGRANDCDMVLNSKQVSRHHANISLLGTVLVIDDLQSANGTFVNNQRVTEQLELHDGDQIAFSRGERFLLSLKRAATDLDQDDNSYAQAVDKAEPIVEAPRRAAEVGDDDSDTLIWVAIGVAVVLVAGFAVWAFA